jgi:hypothetical protein
MSTTASHFLEVEGDLSAALAAAHHPDDAHKLRCICLQFSRQFGEPAEGFETLAFVSTVEALYLDWIRTLTRLPESGDRILWVPEIVELPALRGAAVDRLEQQLIRTEIGAWVDPRNVVWLGSKGESWESNSYYGWLSSARHTSSPLTCECSSRQQPASGRVTASRSIWWRDAVHSLKVDNRLFYLFVGALLALAFLALSQIPEVFW